MEDSTYAQDHIVVVGIVGNIKHFIMPLRADHFEKLTPIVILNDEPPDPK